MTPIPAFRPFRRLARVPLHDVPLRQALVVPRFPSKRMLYMSLPREALGNSRFRDCTTVSRRSALHSFVTPMSEGSGKCSLTFVAHEIDAVDYATQSKTCGFRQDVGSGSWQDRYHLVLSIVWPSPLTPWILILILTHTRRHTRLIEPRLNSSPHSHGASESRLAAAVFRA